MIHATAIAWLDGEIQKHGNSGELAERFKRYAEQARKDFAMYAWLEQHGALPSAAKGVKPRHVKAWQQSQEQVTR